MKSTEYKNWLAELDFRTCLSCRKNHGKIYHKDEHNYLPPPLHDRCRCIVEWLQALAAGTATDNGANGADWWLKNYHCLPDYYISESDAKALGWKTFLGNLNQVAPDTMLTKGVYQNREQHLPVAENRIWYEADINYENGFRGSERILFSNDGLIFVTYDHYKTFVEII